MKLIIDVNEQTYKDIKNYREIFDGQIHILTKSIINGTPLPDNATNGDMIKALFPNTKVDFHNLYGCIYWSEEISSPIYLDWWNAPYKKGKNK